MKWYVTVFKVQTLTFFLQCMTTAATFVKVVVDVSYKTIPFISIDICIHSWLSS